MNWAKSKWVQVKDIKIRAEEKSGTILSLPFMGSDGTMRQETTYSLTLQRYQSEGNYTRSNETGRQNVNKAMLMQSSDRTGF